MRYWTGKKLMLAALASLGPVSQGALAEEPPETEFLLYLAEMRRVDGEWVDPMSVEEMAVPGGEAPGDAPGRADERPEEDSDEQ